MLTKITIVFDEDEKRFFVEKLEDGKKESRPLPHRVAEVLLEYVENGIKLCEELSRMPLEEADMLPKPIAQGVVSGAGTFAFISNDEYNRMKLTQVLGRSKGSEGN